MALIWNRHRSDFRWKYPLQKLARKNTANFGLGVPLDCHPAAIGFLFFFSSDARYLSNILGFIGGLGVRWLRPKVAPRPYIFRNAPAKNRGKNWLG